MASELRVNTLKDASGNNSVGMSTVAERKCKSLGIKMVDMAMALMTVLIQVSSTDNGTGDI